jgi:hypothetical protein
MKYESFELLIATHTLHFGPQDIRGTLDKCTLNSSLQREGSVLQLAGSKLSVTDRQSLNFKRQQPATLTNSNPTAEFIDTFPFPLL